MIKFTIHSFIFTPQKTNETNYIGYCFSYRQSVIQAQIKNCGFKLIKNGHTPIRNIMYNVQ